MNAEIKLTSKPAAPVAALCFYSKKKEGSSKEKAVPEFLGKKDKNIEELLSHLKNEDFFGAKKNESSLLRFYDFGSFRGVLLVGAGEAGVQVPEDFRKLGATLYLSQKKEKVERVSLDFESFFSKVSASQLGYSVQAFAEGYLLASYEFNDLKSDKKDPAKCELEISGSKLKEVQTAIQTAQVLARSVCFARSLGDRPANYLTPSLFVDLVSERAKKAGLKVKVLGQKQLEAEKMGLLLGVAKGSVEEPKVLILESTGNKPNAKPMVLVGKGITFDSGGISLKPPAKMEEMKYDMMGAGTVAGICLALAELKSAKPFVGIMALCENLPSGKAQKPGDVAIGRNGKSVEVNNTDAEGRLILADVLDYAQEFKPKAIVDFATLTGAVVVALGSVTTGIMGTDRELLDAIKRSSEVTGEKVWELPLYEEYEEDLKGNFADIKNVGTSGEAGSSKGGVFLKSFVPKGVPWVHCDIAGSAWYRKDLNYAPSRYASGVMIRLMVDLIENAKV